jgi:hypothetical protein
MARASPSRYGSGGFSMTQAKTPQTKAIWEHVDDSRILDRIPEKVHIKKGDIDKATGWSPSIDIPKFDCFVRAELIPEQTFCLDCMKAIAYGGTDGNLSDHVDRPSHKFKAVLVASNVLRRPWLHQP